METRRQKQIGELVKRNFSMVLQQEGTYIYGAAPMVSVTEVKMSPDLSVARIYLSVYNTENKQAVLLELEDNLTHLKQALASRIKKQVRRIPDINFFIDDTIDEMYRLESLFKRLEDENQLGEKTEGEED